MKYFLTMAMNPKTWESLSEDQQNAVFQGHDDFIRLTTDSGELVGTKALDGPDASTTVRVRGGETTATPGLATEADEFFCGYYVVECATAERAVELAALIPDARYTSIEVRPIVHEAGAPTG